MEPAVINEIGAEEIILIASYATVACAEGNS
jgi:hypothetical protein